MGYGVHGNEPSASNVAPLVAYHLAAGMGETHQSLLRNLVVLLDPCLNPDGFERFAHWANQTRGRVASADPEHREHQEPWPRGRTNYYYFDLNRDWLPAQHPETHGRLAIYHQWKPNLVLDFHEMGSNSTYFFQPGVPRRNHPLIPATNLELTRGLARYHARALDRLGSLYFTEEQFDDFYPGKGSTYPDLHGGVGVLFEQASSRGQVQETSHGKITFAFTIRNQFHTSLSSLRGLHALRTRFLEYKRDFYRSAREDSSKQEVKYHLIAAPGDRARLHLFAELLTRHDIHVHRLRPSTRIKVGEKVYQGDEAFLIPTDQPESRFLQTLFETRTSFADRIFYDVSAWTLPLAFNLQHAPLTRLPDKEELGEQFQSGSVPEHVVSFTKDDVAYVIDWRGYHAAPALYQLLSAGVKVRVSSSSFKILLGKEERSFAPGTLVVPIGIQPDKRETVVAILQKAARAGVEVYPLLTGLTAEGPKLGSSDMRDVPVPRILLVSGEGVNAYEAGEVWHLLDRRLEMPLTMVDTNRLGSVDLAKYSVVILVGGTYQGVSATTAERLKQYAERGGTIVGVGTAISWLASRKVVPVSLREAEKVSRPVRRPYASAERDAASRLISGAIFQTSADSTHPLCYGYRTDEPLAVFRNTRVILEPATSPFNSPVVYMDKPLLSGYVSADNLKLLAGSASVVVVPAGSGRAILMADNPNFRSFWLGTERLFVNALFFGPITRTGAARMRGE
jgi:hypothetical protein